jgi:hydroxyacylglutathione hydrolase
MKIEAIKSFEDNYIWIIHDNNQAVVIDPGDSEPVISFIKKNNTPLNTILITHHHNDHTGGVLDLVKKYNCNVYAPLNSSYKFQFSAAKEGDQISLLDDKLLLNVLETPGHTLDHIIYFNQEIIFVGDTLFHYGCGRVFEGTNEMLFNSLKKIKQLENKANVYCAHEYTKNNLKFLVKQFPNNQHYKEKLDIINKINITIPFCLDNEIKLNPFLTNNLSDFINLRNAKNQF